MLINVRLMVLLFFFLGDKSWLVCMVRITFMYIDTIFVFYGYIDFKKKKKSLLLSLMFEHDCLDTCCFGCLVCMCFVFLY